MLIVKNEEVIVTLAVAILVEKPLSHKDHGITYIILTILVGEHTFFFILARSQDVLTVGFYQSKSTFFGSIPTEVI